MAIWVRDFFGTIILLVSLVMASSVVAKEYCDSGGIPVLLSHRCTQQEKSIQGESESRGTFVRYRSDHSSFVNRDLMPVKDDLRREIRRRMATRQEQVVTFVADDALVYREVLDVLSDLRQDDPELVVVMLTTSQVGSVEAMRSDRLNDLCTTFPR
jgi:biopolymer transport protein ExbD